VVGISDSDTLTLLVDRRQVKVRLAETDTPELRQPWGTRARQALSDLGWRQEARVVVVDQTGSGGQGLPMFAAMGGR
jgi:endonuclease YncB( thermonuclease family)